MKTLSFDETEAFAVAKERVVAQFTRAYTADALKRAKGNVSEAARLSGLDRPNFRRLARRYGSR